MSGILDRCKKRRCYPVDLGDGDKVFVRALRYDEIDRVQAMEADLSVPFILGLSLVDEAGNCAVTPLNDGETDSVWASRLKVELQSIPTDTTNQLIDAIQRVSRPQKVDDVAKNS